MLQRRFWMRGGGSRLAALAAIFTTLCCLGFPALVGLLPQTSGGDHMADGMAAPHTWSPFLAYGVIIVLLGAQVWDLWLYRRCAPKAAPVRTYSPSALRERRKEGV